MKKHNRSYMDNTHTWGRIFMVTAIFPVEVNPASYGLAILGIAPLPFALVYHIVHYRRKFKINKFFYLHIVPIY